MSHAHAGIDDGIWWAMVTATTVGYGDVVPKTQLGRTLAVLFMVIGIALFAILSGHLASEFVDTRDDIGAPTTLKDIRGLHLCGYPSVLGSSLFSGIKITKTLSTTMDRCGELLQNGAVDAVVYDGADRKA